MNKIKRNGSTSRWRKIRLAILRRDNHTCYYCGIPTATTVDHLTPVEQGGDDSFNNLVSACANCNYSKGNRTEEQYIKDRNKKHRSKIMKQNENNNRFFEHDKTSPTPAMFFSPKGLKSPFEKPKVN
jgi:5-methylcytosine-specific restriction endonuclease McrA